MAATDCGRLVFSSQEDWQGYRWGRFLADLRRAVTD